MSLFGELIHRSARLAVRTDQRRHTPGELQKRQLRGLLRYARHTEFGRYYHFSRLLTASQPADAFRTRVPAVDYNTLYNNWWSKAHLLDQPDVCWPGLTPYFALSSGTSQAATKYIPMTAHQLRAMKRGSRRMFFALSGFGLPPEVFRRQMLMIGSCTRIRREGRHFTGDASGILGKNRPLWMERFYRPGRDITALPEWSDRIERIAEAAPRWNIGSAVANPMWLQLVLERIVERHKLAHIHELWPDFSVLAYGGVFIEPYQPTLEALFGREMHYINTYLASEGFFGFQSRPDTNSIALLPDGGIFFEFVPFNDDNFTENGDLRSEFPDTHTLAEVRPGQPYALLISTCAGAWRYLLGDTVEFTDLRRAEVRLTGRTKQYLSTCGEHLSIDNLNAAVRDVNRSLNAGIGEFTVAGTRAGDYWAHEWFLSAENPALTAEQLAAALDAALCRLNDDYAIERRYALREVHLRRVASEQFLGWLAQRGKCNGQGKIPRVLKGKQLEDFKNYLKI